MRGFWAARIHLEAEGGNGKPLEEYFDMLLSPDEQLDKSSERIAAYFDSMIEGGEATEQ